MATNNKEPNITNTNTDNKLETNATNATNATNVTNATNEVSRQNSVLSNPNLNSITPAMFELSNAILTTIQQAAIKYYLDLVTPILSIFYSQLKSIVPSGNDVEDSKQLSKSILRNLTDLIDNDPKFREEYIKTAKAVALFIKLGLNEVLDVFEDEGDILITRIGDSAKKIAVNVSATAYDTVQDFLSVIPGPDALIAVFNLVTSGITNGAQIMLSGIEIFGHIIQLSEKITGNTIGPAGDTIQQIETLLQMVRNPGSGAVPIINDATKTVNDFNKVNSVIPQVKNTTEKINEFNTMTDVKNKKGGNKTRKRYTKKAHKSKKTHKSKKSRTHKSKKSRTHRKNK